MKFSHWKIVATALTAFASVAVGAAAIAQRGGHEAADGPKGAAPVAKPDPLQAFEGDVDPAARTQDVARARAIYKGLNAQITMSFPTGTPLEDVLKLIRQSTRDEKNGLPNGIPIYVDPVGLQEADKTLNSTVWLELEGVPLKRTLQLALKQLGLCYHVSDDGLIMITSSVSGVDDYWVMPLRNGPSPRRLMEDKAERGEMTAQERKEFIEMLKDLKTIEDLLHPHAGNQ